MTAPPTAADRPGLRVQKSLNAVQARAAINRSWSASFSTASSRTGVLRLLGRWISSSGRSAPRTGNEDDARRTRERCEKEIARGWLRASRVGARAISAATA